VSPVVAAGVAADAGEGLVHADAAGLGDGSFGLFDDDPAVGDIVPATLPEILSVDDR
jgi:hypothetical protein